MDREASPFKWPFAKQRQLAIDEADQLIAEAEELLDDPAVKPFTPNVVKRYRRAAKKYEKSAELYARAGLGLMAQASWQDAGECWFRLGDADNVRRCELRSDAIPVYYDEDDDDL